MDINETMENMVEKTAEQAEVIRDKAEEAMQIVAEMDASTIVKIGVVGGLVGAAAGAFVFTPIRNKIAGALSGVKNWKADTVEKLNGRKAEATQKKIEKLQKGLDKIKELKEEKED